MHNLAVLYAEGIDGKPDYRIAAQWFRRAAAHGVADSQFNLAILYARGIGIEQNLAESYKWFMLAANMGDHDAARKRDEVATRLDQQTIMAAKLAVQTFTAQREPEEATSLKTPPGGWDRTATAAQPVKPRPAPARPPRRDKGAAPWRIPPSPRRHVRRQPKRELAGAARRQKRAELPRSSLYRSGRLAADGGPTRRGSSKKPSGPRACKSTSPSPTCPVNIFLILGMGLAVGFISGMFGIGGGFLMTPLLIFVGIAPAVVVASVASHVAASSMSGAMTYWRRNAVDLALALMLLAGGILGTAAGVWLFTLLRSLDQLDLTIALSYVALLTVVGGLMINESVRAIIREQKGQPVTPRRAGAHTWVHGLPLKMRFKRSKIYVSAIPVWAIGFIIGFFGALMGIGGGFLLVPMLIYFLRVPTATVIGTSMVLTLITMASATVMHAATNHLVDAVLALILMVGGVVGAQFGARAGQNMRGERLRLLLGLLVFAVGLRFAYQVIVQPGDLYSIRLIGGM